jgi:chromosome partitioning protein
MAQHRIVAVAAGRGGSAKTTLTFAMGDVLHRLRGIADVALLDLDPQANLTSYAGQDPVDDPLAAPGVTLHGLTLYRGGRGLALADVRSRAAHVQRALAEGSPDRVVIADLPPALHDPSHRVLMERDDVFWLGAIRAEPGSFQSLNELVAMCARADAPYVLVPTFHLGNRSVIAATSMALRSQHPGHVTRTVLPDDSKAKECVLAGMPVTLFAPRAKASQAVVALMDEVFGEGDLDAAPDPAKATRDAAPAAAAATTSHAPPRKSSARRSGAPAGAPVVVDSAPTSAVPSTSADEATGAGTQRRRR